MRPLVVTGCQRSGTAWTAAVLTTAGWWASHERFFNEDRHWPLKPTTVEVSWAAAPFLADLDDAVIVHQTRHPLAVVGSLMTQGKFTGRSKARSALWAMEHVPGIGGPGGGLGNTLRYWFLWNRLVETHAHLRWQVETLTVEEVAEALALSGREPDPQRISQALAIIPNTVNSNPASHRLTWENLPDRPISQKVRKMAERYGYTQ